MSENAARAIYQLLEKLMHVHYWKHKNQIYHSFVVEDLAWIESFEEYKSETEHSWNENGINVEREYFGEKDRTRKGKQCFAGSRWDRVGWMLQNV